MTTARSLRVGEAVLGGGVVALGLFVAVQTASMRVTATTATIGPKLFPYLIAAGLIVIGAFVLREAFFGHIAHERGFELDLPAAGWVSAGLIAQMLLIETVGWIIAATLMFVAVARPFGGRGFAYNLAVGLALSCLTFLIFNYGLDLNLPTGEVFESLLADDTAG
jgi:putative tricarboxylic transport membrane protein